MMAPLAVKYSWSMFLNYHVDKVINYQYNLYKTKQNKTNFMYMTWNVNSLVPWRSQCDLKNAMFNLVLFIGTFRSSYNNAKEPY